MSTLTISAFNPAPGYYWPGDTAKLRIVYNQTFIASDGTQVESNSVGSKQGFFVEVDCAVVSHVLQIPSFVLITTDDAQPIQTPQATATACLFSQDGTYRGNIFANWTIFNKLAPSCSYSSLAIANAKQSILYPPNWYLNEQQVLQLIQNAVGSANVATTTSVGLTEIDTDPTDPLHPKAVGINSPLLSPTTNFNFPYYNPLAYGCLCDGTTNDTTAMAALITLIAGAQARIIFPKNGHCLLSNITFPANITVDFQSSGGSIKVVTGQTVHIQGPQWAAPDAQVFFNVFAGQGHIDFFTSNTSLSEVYLEWLGATSAGDWSGALAALTTGFGGATPVNLVINQSMTFNGTFTIPSFINLKFTNSGRINVSSGSITHVGPLDIPANTQAFALDNGVLLSTNTLLSYIDPQWWGFSAAASATTNTAAFEAAVDALPSTGGKIILPSSATPFALNPVTILNRYGLVIQGAGKGGTILAPSTACEGLSVINLRNVRDSTIRDMRINGNSVHVPYSGIESRVDEPRVVTSANITFSNILIGSDVASSIENGIAFTCNLTPGACSSVDFGCNQNNEQHTLFDVEVRNYTNAGLFVGHSNSLLHKIIGGQFAGGPIGVQLNGGSFEMWGTAMIGLTDVVFDFQNPPSGEAYEHPIMITNVNAEICQDLLRTSTVANIAVHMAQVDFKFSIAPATTIDFKSAGGLFYMTDSHIVINAPGSLAQFTSATSAVSIADTYWGISTLTAAGQLTFKNSDQGGYKKGTLERRGFTKVSADYTALATDGEIDVDATAGVVTVHLPITFGSGASITIRKIDSGANHVTVTADGNGIQLGSKTLAAQWDFVTVSYLSGSGFTPTYVVIAQ